MSKKKVRFDTEDLTGDFHPVNPLTGEVYDGSTVYYRYMPMEDVHAIMSRCYTIGAQMKSTLDSILLYRILASEAVHKWDGMEMAEGEELPCSEEMRMNMPKWIRDQVLVHSKALDQVDAIIQNSLKKQGGDSDGFENPPEAGADTSDSPDTQENTSSPESNPGDGPAESASS